MAYLTTHDYAILQVFSMTDIRPSGGADPAVPLAACRLSFLPSISLLAAVFLLNIFPAAGVQHG
jgi:hypothetical protein